MIKAVIFDMDGLMIDSERVTYEGYVIVCGKLGLRMEEAFYKQVLGLPLPTVFQMFYDKYGSSFPMEQVLEQVHRYMDDRFCKEGVPVKEGLKDLLDYLKRKDYKTIVATSSNRDRVDRILEQTKLTGYFDDSICGDEIERGKPHPDIFQKACEKMGVKPEEAIVLEDSEAGIQAAFSAGIPVICVPDMKYPREGFREKTVRIVDSLTELSDLFRTGQLR
ncbi:MAG: HAD family phosphatase [Lachnospiraceae bacterium]|nr:HAD family phosphatase [Lachnospiraceae bacterium]